MDKQLEFQFETKESSLKEKLGEEYKHCINNRFSLSRMERHLKEFLSYQMNIGEIIDFEVMCDSRNNPPNNNKHRAKICIKDDIYSYSYKEYNMELAYYLTEVK